jgi:hypothetical protein
MEDVLEKRWWVGALMLGAGLSVFAGSGPYFNTYTHHMEAGEWELEVASDQVRYPDGGSANGQALELEHGFGEHLSASLYILGTKAPSEAWRLDGYKLEGRFRPWIVKSFWVPTFYLEYEQFHHPETYRNAVVGSAEPAGQGEPFKTEHEAEARLIFSRDFDWGNVAVNLIAERCFDGGKTTFGYTAAFFLLGRSSGIEGPSSFDPDGDGDSHLLYGLELFGGLGEEGDFGFRRSGQEHYAGPFVSFPISSRVTLKTGVAVGLTRQPEDRLRAVLVVRLGKAA